MFTLSSKFYYCFYFIDEEGLSCIYFVKLNFLKPYKISRFQIDKSIDNNKRYLPEGLTKVWWNENNTALTLLFFKF